MTDTERLDWLQKTDCMSLISDDSGHWACTQDGFQTVPPEFPEAGDIHTTFFVAKGQWYNSIREAIDAAMRAEQDEEV